MIAHTNQKIFLANKNLRVETVQNFFIILHQAKMSIFGLNRFDRGLISL